MTLRARSIHNPEERSTRLRIDRLKGIKNDLIFLSSLACVCALLQLSSTRKEESSCVCTSFLRRVRRNAPQQEVCIFRNELFSFRRIRDEAWRDSKPRSAFPPVFLFFRQFSSRSHERELNFSPYSFIPPFRVYRALISFILIKNK